MKQLCRSFHDRSPGNRPAGFPRCFPCAGSEFFLNPSTTKLFKPLCLRCCCGPFPMLLWLQGRLRVPWFISATTMCFPLRKTPLENTLERNSVCARVNQGIRELAGRQAAPAENSFLYSSSFRPAVLFPSLSFFSSSFCSLIFLFLFRSMLRPIITPLVPT